MQVNFKVEHPLELTSLLLALVFCQQYRPTSRRFDPSRLEHQYFASGGKESKKDCSLPG